MIKHVWFDLGGTLTKNLPAAKNLTNELLYRSYSGAVHKPIGKELIEEFQQRLKKSGNSHSALFQSLGLPADFWAKKRDSMNLAEVYTPDPNIYGTLEQLKAIVPISLFTNIWPEKILPILKIDIRWFTHIIKGGMVKESKPALEGFNKVIELSNLPAEQILYVGDIVEKDILPAKAVGLKTCLVWSASPQADYSFENFQDILTLFQ